MESYASAAQIYAAGLVFTRVGAMVMMMPGVGDPAIPVRVRLSFAFLLALVLAPVVSGGQSPVPSTLAGEVGGVLHEALIGVMIGAILKVFVGALTTAGEVISMQTTLGFAQTANPAQAQSTTAVSAFLSMLGLLLIMTTDLHHMFLAAIANSFQLFPFAKALPIQDGTTLMLQTVSGSFALGIQLAAPVIVFSLVFNLATGLIGRVMPAFQIFFVASPLSVLLGLSIFALSLGGIGMVWSDRYRDLLNNFVSVAMADDNDAASKTEEPSSKKLQDARARGETVKTPELSSLLSLTAVFAVVAMGGNWLARDLVTKLTPFLAHADAFAMDGAGGVDVGRTAIMAALPAVLAVTLAAGLAGAAGNLIQTGFMFTPSKLAPDFGRLNVLKSFGRLFAMDNLANFGKSAAKILITGVVAWYNVKPHAAEMYNLPGMPITEILPLSMKLAQGLLISVVCFLLVTAGADWFYQRQSFMKKMRMTKEEMKDEFKQAEGDPHVKARQKQIRNEKARRRMIQNVAKATVVVMNPTHFAVALRYEAGETAAPMCVAKGMDSLALRIRAVAEENGVTVVEDPPLARALYATTEIDAQIPEQHFQAVAKVIGFVLNRRRRSTARPRAMAAR